MVCTGPGLLPQLSCSSHPGASVHRERLSRRFGAWSGGRWGAGQQWHLPAASRPPGKSIAPQVYPQLPHFYSALSFMYFLIGG